MSIADVLAPYSGRDLIPLPEIGRAVGLDAPRQTYAVTKGLIHPADKRGPNGRYLVTRDEAVFILTAAALALAAGIAIVTMIRTLRAAGAKVSGSAITIPVGAL